MSVFAKVAPKLVVANVPARSTQKQGQGVFLACKGLCNYI